MSYTAKLGTRSPVNTSEQASNAHASNLEAQQLCAEGLMKSGQLGLTPGTSPSPTTAGVAGQWSPGVGGSNYVWTAPSVTKQTAVINPANYTPFPQQFFAAPYSCTHSIGDNAVYTAAFRL